MKDMARSDQNGPRFSRKGALTRVVIALLLVVLTGGFGVGLFSAPLSTPSAFAATVSYTKPHKVGTFIHLARGARPSSAAVAYAGTGYNGTDPYGTMCAGQTWDSWWVVDSVPVILDGVNYGWTQLWWSQTCGTNWARYVCSSRCSGGELSLMTCEGNTYYVVQGPVLLTGTGRTKQEYLPTTRARAELRVLGGVTGSHVIDTGCY